MMMVPQAVREAVADFSWVKAAEKVGVPAVVAMTMLFGMLWIGKAYMTQQREYQETQAVQEMEDRRAIASQLAKDTEARQRMLERLVDSTIDSNRTSIATMSRMEQTVSQMHALSEQSVRTDAIVVGNQDKIIKSLDEAKRCNDCLIEALGKLSGKAIVPPPAKASPRGSMTQPPNTNRGPT